MKCITPNEGISDRAIRVTLGVLLLVAAYIWLAGILQVVAYILGGISLVTGITGFCGLYKILGINTCPMK